MGQTRKRKKRYTAFVAMRLLPEQKRQIHKAIHRRGLTLNEWVREAINAHLSLTTVAADSTRKAGGK